MVIPLGKIITRNRMKSTEQPAQISFLTTQIGGSEKYLMVIADPFRSDTEDCTDPTIQQTIVHFNQETGLGHSYRNHSPFVSFDSGTDVPRSMRNIDNRTG